MKPLFWILVLAIVGFFVAFFAMAPRIGGRSTPQKSFRTMGIIFLSAGLGLILLAIAAEVWIASVIGGVFALLGLGFFTPSFRKLLLRAASVLEHHAGIRHINGLGELFDLCHLLGCEFRFSRCRLLCLRGLLCRYRRHCLCCRSFCCSLHRFHFFHYCSLLPEAPARVFLLFPFRPA